MERLEALCGTARSHLQRANPPSADVHYSDEFIQQLESAIQEALAAPATDPAAIYASVTRTMKKDVKQIDPRVDSILLQSVAADTIVGAGSGETVLHELMSRAEPPPLAPQEGRLGVSLQQLLARGATPDLQDASGSTALHLLVVRIAKESIYPDLEPEMAMQVEDADRLYRDDERIAYLEGVGGALLAAGWSLDLANGKGRTMRRLLQLSHHIAEAKRVALQKGLEHTLELTIAAEQQQRQQGRAPQPGALSAAASADALRRQSQRQMERVDCMQAVLARLQEKL